MRNFSCKTILLALTIHLAFTNCNNQSNGSNGTETAASGDSGKEQLQSQKFVEGSDYMLFERARILDKMGFTEPQEAYSILVPKGWTSESDIVWSGPGSSCDGTYRWLKAKSADGKYSLEMMPDKVFSWSTNQELIAINQSIGSSSPYCTWEQPMDAENYLKNVFVKEIGNPEVTKVEPNQHVVEQMREWNEKTRNELTQYGAGQVNFYQTAVNADVRWPDNSAGMVVLGVTILETVVPNAYTGGYDKSYTSQVTKRTVFKYPSAESEQAKKQFSLIMGSFRTNPVWNDAVNQYWKDVRQKKHVVHVGKIKAMDEQTRQMGEAAIRAGNERLKNMDTQMRTWEQQQSSQDRMHTNFIKTIREVENYKDETGKVELSSGYNHAWSRSDGSSFILSDNPNFNPASVFQDQRWKEMKKVD